MTTEQQNNTLEGIHAALNEMEGSGQDFLFLSGHKNMGVLSGSLKGLAAMFVYNMAAYPVFRVIIKLASDMYRKNKAEIDKLVKENRPSQEIVNTFGYDFSKMIENLERENL